MTDLKPCPCCGASAEIDSDRGYRNISTGNLESEVAIYCLACALEISMCKKDVPNMSTDEIIFYLTSAWNSRVND